MKFSNHRFVVSHSDVFCSASYVKLCSKSFDTGNCLTAVLQFCCVPVRFLAVEAAHNMALLEYVTKLFVSVLITWKHKKCADLGPFWSWLWRWQCSSHNPNPKIRHRRRLGCRLLEIFINLVCPVCALAR